MDNCTNYKKNNFFFKYYFENLNDIKLNFKNVKTSSQVYSLFITIMYLGKTIVIIYY